jgi:hypothetical protein
MKVGDLVKWNGWRYPMIIVGLKHDVVMIGSKRETYYRCMAGNDPIWIFESDLEPIIS